MLSWMVAAALAGCPSGGGGNQTPLGPINYSTFSNNLATSTTTGALTGTVETPDGNPVMGARVTISQTPSARQATVNDFTVLTNDQGVFQIGSIPGGVYLVVVRHETIVTSTLELTITPGVIQSQVFTTQPTP